MRKPRSVVFFLAGILLGLVTLELIRRLFYVHPANAPWTVYAMAYGFRLVFALATVACFRAALADWRRSPVEVEQMPRRH